MAENFLIIGMGGSGGKTLRYIWRELDRRLADLHLEGEKWSQGMPGGWQFLHIDVPHDPDVITGDVPAHIGKDARYLGLAHSPETYVETYDEQLVEDPHLLPGVVGWRPDPNEDYANIYNGAGQRRSVGRAVTLVKLKEVGDAIKGAVAAQKSSNVIDQMKLLDRYLGKPGNTQEAELGTAMVITSLGGGAGSGAFLDVIELLRSSKTEGGQWLGDSLITVLYAADVFADLDDGLRLGIEPNTLAAISELLGASEHEGTVSGVESRWTQRGGGTGMRPGRRAGRHTFIVGRQNAQVDLGTGLAVFRATGKALSSLIIDDSVRGPFRGYLTTNGQGTKLSERFEPLSDRGRCSSLGYANVSLGRALFAQYASERLAKRAIERLVRGHLEVDGEARLQNPESLIAARVNDSERGFYNACQLFERDDESPVGDEPLIHDQVLDALRNKNEVREQANAAGTSVKKKLEELKGNDAPRRIFERLQALFDDQVVDFEQWAHRRRDERAQEWVESVQRAVRTATADHAGRYGLPVALALLDSLDKEVLAAADQLEVDASEQNAKETGVLTSLRNMFVKPHERHIGPGHQSITEALGFRRTAMLRRFEADLAVFTAQVLRDLSRDLLPPLRRALSDALRALATAELQDDKTLIAQWSQGDVPPHLSPAENELLLEKVTTFPEELARLLNLLFDDVGRKAAEEAALAEIITGSWPSRADSAGAPTDQTLIRKDSPWGPGTRSGARVGSNASGAAAFDVELSPRGIFSRAEKWVLSRQGALSAHVDTTLAEWLGDQRERVSRAAIFADAFDQALGAALPLISVNEQAHRYVHAEAPPAPMSLISAIPIGPKHDAYERIVASLLKAGVPETRFPDLFQPTSERNSVEISSFLSKYVHPVVFDSLTTPIQRDWQSRSTSHGGRREFWEFRRARPLRAFVPLSKSRQVTLVRGWLTAGVLGHVGPLAGRWSDNPLDIWTPRGPRAFPRHLLGRDVARRRDVLPALLESMPLAFLTLGTGEPAELEAYLRLLELGAQSDDDGEGPRVNDEVGRWVVHGQTTPPNDGFEAAPTPPSELADTAASTPAERAEAIVTAFGQFQAEYAADADKPITRETTLTVGPRWEIRELVADATKALIEEVAGVPESTTFKDSQL
jgi:Tubulin like